MYDCSAIQNRKCVTFDFQSNFCGYDLCVSLEVENAVNDLHKHSQNRHTILQHVSYSCVIISLRCNRLKARWRVKQTVSATIYCKSVAVSPTTLIHLHLPYAGIRRHTLHGSAETSNIVAEQLYRSAHFRSGMMQTSQKTGRT